MTVLRLENGYTPLPPQAAFRKSKALIRGFGGAMGGGKSRALCEEVFDWMLEHPGIEVAVFRQLHTAITNSTRKTFIEQVLPQELRSRPDLVRIKASGGEDFVRFLWSGSTVHFVGLDNPGRWFSTELGAACFDEAHEIDEKSVTTINTRLRQRCKDCIAHAKETDDCTHMPHRMILTFNPSYPGHWLQQWFVLGSTRTEFGFKKENLIVQDAEEPIGDCEFFISRATENPYLPSRYIERNLAGMSKMERRRYLDGLWEHVGGNSFFDDDALAEQTQASMEYECYEFLLPNGRSTTKNCEPDGDFTGLDADKRPHIRGQTNGRMEVYHPPVRWHVKNDGTEVKEHRYVVSVDASSGVSSDYSAVQVVDVEDFEQVAEWQGKVDPDKLAEVAFLTACIYNGATLAPEITGGWGFAVVKRCQAMIAKWEGPTKSKPMLYTRPVVDRLSQKFTDLIGWDTNTKSRAQMLDILEQSLRDGSVQIHGQRTLAELAAFAIPERMGNNDYRSPRAQKGAHDDLVIALAIGVAVASKLPKNIKLPPRPIEEPMWSATGW